jgi:outer membrane biosynthesis protein TonB
MPPLNSPYVGLVVLGAEPDAQGDVQNLSVLAGTDPFLEASLAAVKQWKFSAADRSQKRAAVSITLLYRARQVYSPVGAVEFPEWPLQDERPPLPRVVLDPEYPVRSIAEGVVILQLEISAAGIIERMDTVRDVPSLTEAARRTVENWTFSPALTGGKPAAGTAIVVISFLRPIVN